MKSPCCFIVVILLIISIGMHYLTLQKLDKLKQPPLPVASATVSPTPQIVSSPAPISSPAPVEDALLYKISNPSACSFTDTAKFKLEEDHQISKLETWYSWAANETSLSYKLKQGDKVIHEGTLVRKSCDPYQGQWCQAIDESVKLSLNKGEYSLIASNSKICQNNLSSGQGFIYVYGK